MIDVATLHRLAAGSLLLATAGAAGDEHDDGSDQSQDARDEGEPCGRAVFGVPVAVVVDLVAEEGEEDKVDDEGDGVDDEGGKGNKHGQDGHDGATREQAKEEGHEQNGGADGVEDQHARERLDGVATGIAVPNVGDTLDHIGWVVADGGAGALPAGRECVSKRCRGVSRISGNGTGKTHFTPLEAFEQ